MPDEVRTSSGNAEDHLIRDLAYEIVELDAFKAMVDIDHYDRRSHDFDQPFDMDKEYLMSPERIQELSGSVLDWLDEG